MIRIEGLHKQFGNLEVLKGIDLTIEKGKVIVIIGPSGSGKTTLLRCMNALEIPNQGRIQIDDVSVDFSQHPGKKELSALRQKSGMVFQQYNLFPHKTVLENVIEGPVIVKKENRQDAAKKAEMLLEKVACLIKKRRIQQAFPAASSSAPGLRGRLQWSRK